MNCCSFVFSEVKLGAPNRNTPIWAPSALPPRLVGQAKGLLLLQMLPAQGMGWDVAVGTLWGAVGDAIRHP